MDFCRGSMMAQLWADRDQEVRAIPNLSQLGLFTGVCHGAFHERNEEPALRVVDGRSAKEVDDIHGPDDVQQLIFAVQDDELIAEGDKVVERYTVRGTHQGAFLGIPPTGKHVSVSALGIDRIKDGKIVETWISMDTLGLLQQLGAIPQLAPAGP